MDYTRFTNPMSFNIKENIIQSGLSSWQISQITKLSVESRTIPCEEKEPKFEVRPPPNSSTFDLFVIAIITLGIIILVFGNIKDKAPLILLLIIIILTWMYLNKNDEELAIWAKEKDIFAEKHRRWSSIKTNPLNIHTLTLELSSSSTLKFYGIDFNQIMRAKEEIENSINDRTRNLNFNIDALTINSSDSIVTIGSNIYERIINGDKNKQEQIQKPP
jgi:hypothetical protein